MSRHNIVIPEFDIEGTKYTFRRIGGVDTEYIVNLAKDLWKCGIKEVFNYQNLAEALYGEEGKEFKLDPQLAFNIAMLISMALGRQEYCELMIRFLRKIDENGKKQKVTLDELNDPDLFPAYSEIDTLIIFMHHPDLWLFCQSYAEGKQLDFFKMLRMSLLE